MADAPETQAAQPSDSPKKSGGNKLVIVIIVVVALLAVAGYGMRKVQSLIGQKVGEKMAEGMIESASGGKAKVDFNDKGVTVKTKEGTFSSGTELPADFPKDVPVYPGAKVTYSGTNTSDSSGAGMGVMLTTTDSSEKVAEYYTKELKTQGWSIDSTQNMAGTTVIGATKDTRTLSVAAVSADGATNITLGISTENK